MVDTDFASAFKSAVDDAQATRTPEQWDQDWEALRAEAEGIIDDAVQAMRQVMGRDEAVAIEPWFTTNEGTGRKIVLRASNGYEVNAFTVGVPLQGYPVTLRVADDVLKAHDATDLRGKLLIAMRHPAVASLASYVKAM